MYSNLPFANITASLLKFLQDLAVTGQPLDGLSILETPYDASRGLKKPALLVYPMAPRLMSAGADGGFVRDDFDDQALTVDTIHASIIVCNYQLDIAADTRSDLDTWTSSLFTRIKLAEPSGIPVYNLKEEPQAPQQIGTLFYCTEAAMQSNFLDERPERRTLRNAVRFSPEYCHLYVQTPAQPQLTSVTLTPKPKEVV